ncbi:MAG: PQQ-dependent sugar dehydrogenase [Actinomycetota bacterium]
MRARAPAATLLAATALIAVGAGCGDSDDEATTAPPAPSAPDRQADRPEPPVGDGRGGVKLTEIGDFDQPVYVTQPPGEARDLYVVEQTGRIRVVHDGRVLPDPFLDLSGEIALSEEQGLLSMAFAPDYQRSGLFYVDYTAADGANTVAEYRRSDADPFRADPGSARSILDVEDPYPNHNGGLVVFGSDGQLYVGLGDGGDGGDPERRGQDLSTLLGKILRIDPLSPSGGAAYSVPRDNPFVDRPGALPEIFAYGLRNPWRFSFDRKTGALSIGDVGQDSFEEIDYVSRRDAAGANFGWSAFEGDARFNEDQTAPGYVPPVLTYGLDGACSVIGGYVVRDPNLRSLYGRYLYADLCVGQLRSFVPVAGTAQDDRELGIEVPQPTSFAEDNQGRIYVSSLDGPVYRLDPAG